MNHETEKLEFKVTLTKDVYKEVVAFANTEGGKLIIGVDDGGKMAPLSDSAGDYLSLTNGIRDNIRPDVTMFTNTTLEKNQTIHVEVEEGSNKPYYLKDKGLKPTGVYVRQGTSAVQASRDQIRQMIKNADGDVYEEMRSLNQDLTFEQCRREFEQRNLDFAENKFSSLRITTPIGNIYTNLGLLVSDQNPYTTKVAAFDDEANTIFKDRQEFSGSIFKQVDEILKYLNLHNNTRSIISGHLRYDYPEYAAAAVREAVLNAVIHRDYSVSDSNQIRINQSGIEIISQGSLLPGIAKDDILNGVSRLRNKNLANLFLRLNLIEAYGTGIGRIFNFYKTSPADPQIEILTGSFIMTLPNLNESVTSFIKKGNISDFKNFYLNADEKMKVFIQDKIANSERFKELMKQLVNIMKAIDSSPSSSLNEFTLSLTKQEQTIIDYLIEFDEITDEQVQELLNVKKERAFVIIKKMSEDGLINVIGRGAMRKITL